MNSQSISSQRQTVPVPSSAERARALRSFEPILLNTNYLRTLTHLISEQIHGADPKINLLENDLLYVSKILTFYQLARCDQLHGIVYRDIHIVALHLENLEVPSAIADYIESIGPYRMMNGVNVLPSVASFLPDAWIQGDLIDEDSYALWNSINPQYLPEELDLLGEWSTCWRIVPAVLARYRMCVSRLTKKITTRKISSILAGRAGVICSTTGPSYARQMYSPEESVVSDVRKCSISNFHLCEDIELVPENNRRLLRPWFYAGIVDVSAVINDSLA